MLQFPLYLAAKQSGSRLEDLNNAEATSLAVFLDVSGYIKRLITIYYHYILSPLQGDCFTEGTRDFFRHREIFVIIFI